MVSRPKSFPRHGDADGTDLLDAARRSPQVPGPPPSRPVPSSPSETAAGPTKGRTARRKGAERVGSRCERVGELSAAMSQASGVLGQRGDGEPRACWWQKSGTAFRQIRLRGPLPSTTLCFSRFCSLPAEKNQNSVRIWRLQRHESIARTAAVFGLPARAGRTRGGGACPPPNLRRASCAAARKPWFH